MSNKTQPKPNFNPSYDEVEDNRPIQGAGMGNSDAFVPEVQYNERDFIECPHGCGRRFNPDVIQKHAKVCLKVF